MLTEKELRLLREVLDSAINTFGLELKRPEEPKTLELSEKIEEKLRENDGSTFRTNSLEIVSLVKEFALEEVMSWREASRECFEDLENRIKSWR